MADVAVVICAHNPRPHYLRRVLDGLRVQTLATDRWELILVDNASSNSLAEQFDLTWHPRGKHLFEEKTGLANARIRAMQSTAADLLIFVDDDNLLDPTYLAEAVRIEAEWPRLGVWGSSITSPEYEEPPAQYVSKVLPFLALRNVSEARWCNFVSMEVAPWGAGLCLRKSVADAYRELAKESSIEISGRKGSLLLSGEDVELSYVACDLGLGIGIFPELRLTHLIPRGRLDKDYLLRIVEGTFTSNALLEYKWRGDLPRSPIRFRPLLRLAKDLLFLRGIDREVCLAEVRATIKARRMISSAATLDSSTATK